MLGLLTPERLLDYVENLRVLPRNAEVIAQNHQFIGVNKASTSRRRRSGERQTGCVPSTPRARKSRMAFYAQDLPAFTGNNFNSFVVVTDRDDLDGQIFTATSCIHDVVAPTTMCSRERQLRGDAGHQQARVVSLPPEVPYPAEGWTTWCWVRPRRHHRHRRRGPPHAVRRPGLRTCAGLPNANFLPVHRHVAVGADGKTKSPVRRLRV